MLTKPMPMVSKLEGMFLMHIVTTKLVVINTLGRAVAATWERLRDPVHQVSDPEEPRGGRPLG